MNTRLNRRSFLRGAGALMPLPFLNIMEAKAQGSANDQLPVRFVSLFKPNGIHPPSWNINDGKEHDFQLSPLMKPFAKHKKDLIILDNMGDWGFSGHHDSSRRFLCGDHRNRSASIDQLIAEKIGQGTAVKSLELTTEGLFTNKPECSYISYDKNGKAIPRQSDPQIVFDQLFRSPASNPRKRREMTSLLDRVNDDAKSLLRRAGKEDKQILDEYLTAVRETEIRMQSLSKKQSNKYDFNSFQRPKSAVNVDELVNTMLDLQALALWTDSTRVSSFMLGNDNSRMIFDFLGINEQHHYLSHFYRNFSSENISNLMKINYWHMEKFNYLLTKMKSYRDHNGSLLDHSIVHFGTGMAHSDNHTSKRIPTILAGKGGGLLKTGRYLRYADNQSMSNLHLTLLEKFGINVDSYGRSNTSLQGLSGENFDAYVEREFERWVKENRGVVTVQGRLRFSDDINETRTFYIDLTDGRSVKIETTFKEFHDLNLAYHMGTAVVLSGKGTMQDQQVLIKKVQSIKSLFGKQAGGTPG
ncbi:DUF1552 domain-containing protein [Lentisphaera profundi]|uniref:DUF1552 domain-containing protein n=1 Tax=Lentisphaera profundi TaxID=1658616 RepID=A0ABY7VTR2_9BACT|nr:DUF1552 domain-containing protein [Lentisphaera profundi]WDE97117.1 DUF1552 domain-containing protein [Lentisphaera profundi]